MTGKIILGSTAALAGMAFGAKANVAHADSVNAGSTQTVSQMNTSASTASQAPAVSIPVQSDNATVNNNVSGSASAVKAPAVSQPVAQRQAVTTNAQQGHPVELDINTNSEISNPDTVNTTHNDGLSDGKNAPSTQDPFGMGSTKPYGSVASINGNDWLNGEKKAMHHVINSQNGNSLNIKANSIEKGTPFIAKISNGTLSFTNSSGKQLPTSSGKPYGESGMTDVGVGTEGNNKALWGINPSTGIGTMIEDSGSLQSIINNGQRLLHASSDDVAYMGYDAKATGKDDPYGFDGLLIIQNRGNGFVEIWRDYQFMSTGLCDVNGKIGITGVNNFPEALMLEDAKIIKNADGSVTVSGKPVSEFDDIKLYKATNPTEWTHTFVNNLLAEPSNANNGSSSSTSAAGSSSTNSSSSSTPSNSSSSTPAGNTNSSTSSSITSSSTTTPSSSTSTGSTADSNSSTPTSSNTNGSSSSSANNNLSSSTENSAVSDKTSTDNGDSSVESDNSSNSSTKSDAGSNSSANSSAENESSTASNVSSDTNNSTVTPNASSNSSASAGRSNSNSNNGLPDTGATSGVIALSVVAGLISASAVGAELIKKRA